ncbi:MAG: hypothetical protein JRF43_08265 [Deltaproteobacteria bacterium]|nr:hypothetical protein [Deltaproteobacteria bacterium]
MILGKRSQGRAPHLLCCRALEVQGVRLRTLRLASAAPCKRLQFGGLRCGKTGVVIP